MIFSRRRALAACGSGLVSAASLALAGKAFATETTAYVYDPLGRLARVTFADGTIVDYTYDAAGNRTQVARTTNTTFTATLQITGSGPANLRAIANSNGYNGAKNATITFQLGSAVTVMGAGGPGIDTGMWPSSTYSVALTLEISGKAYGGGGMGGTGAGYAGGTNGTNGGDGIYCRENIAITVNSGGQVKGGGGGGGGGDAWIRSQNGESIFYNGGGGGGGFPSGAAGDEGEADGHTSNPGANGTTSGGGAGGAGGTAMGARVNGAGGAGGGAAASGADGAIASGTSGGTATWSDSGYGFGGAPGYAIRKNGKTVTVTNNGTITGTQA